MTAVLITGRPGVGKTTLVRRILDALDVPAGGFYTRELLGDDGRRTGFELVTLDGRPALLASVDLAGSRRVGRFGVDVPALERIGVPAIESAVEAGRLVVVDEIGKMELLSTTFQRAIIEALRKHRVLSGTIARSAHPFADELKAQPDTLLHELTETNREQLAGLVEMQLRAALGKLSV
jgi:nucleoside-triphosphatase